MIEEEESGKSFNLFEVLNKQVAPVFRRLKKWLWIPLLFGILLFVIGYWMENRKSPEFTAKITFMLEDEVLGESGKAGGTDILSMLSGRAPQSNKGIMVDLAQSNHLVEQTLLRTDTIEKKPQVLVNYYMDVFGYNVKGLSFTSSYKPGSNEEKDRWLRTFSSNIIFNLKAKVQESGVIKAEYSCSNENFAKVFLDNHLITISDFYILKKVERAKVLLVLTKRRRDSLQMLLQGKSYGIAAVQDNSFGRVKRVAAVPEAQMTRDITILNQQYGESVLAMNAASLEMERRRPFISVVDDIRLPLDGVWPKPMIKGLILGLVGLIGGLLLLVGVYFAREFLQKQRQEFELIESSQK